MNIRMEFSGKEKDFHEVNEHIAGTLEFPPLNFDHIGQGGRGKKWWIEFTDEDQIL